MRHKIIDAIRAGEQRESGLCFEAYQDAKRELRMSAMDMLNHFVIYHTAKSNAEAMSFMSESSELRANLTIALCKIYWADESKTWLKKYEDRLGDILRINIHEAA
jgi:hypothetical protein